MQEMIFTRLDDYIKENCGPGGAQEEPAFPIERYRKDDVIFTEGSNGTAAYVVKSGRVEISVKARGKRVVLTVLREGSVFGEMALILGEHKRTATATALTDSEIAKVPKAVFDQYMSESPKLISICLVAIARRLQDTTAKASTSPDAFMGAAQILDLFWEHDQRELSYEKTVTCLWRALSKGKPEIVRVIDMMENLNLLQVQDGTSGDKTISLLGGKGFMERASSIHQMIQRYSDAKETPP
jgi:CRP/FNR family transcriptional regulator, cyclic AMP receptor protein